MRRVRSSPPQFRIVAVALAAAAAALIGLGSPASATGPCGGPAGANPDFTQGGQRPEAATHDWNLGPTGLRGWMYAADFETAQARQILVTRVEAGSPADGIIAVGDVILGVGGQPFSDDPRVAFGRAVTAAEAGSGRLRLICWRDGRQRTCTLTLRRLGPYAPTAPFDCRKSRRILEAGCDAIARRMAVDPDACNPIERSLGALALLAGGRPEHLPLVRHQVAWAARYTDPDRRDLHSWWYGPVTMLLAEYVLATDDRSVMPDLERLAMEIVRGQSPVGSWGHRFVQANGRLAGYGMMNAPGLPLTVALVLARMAGVDDPALDAAIDRSCRLVRFYLGKGSIPYGDHHPWIEAHDDNGKNGIAAVLFHLTGDAEAATWFSRMSVACHGSERDTGHTGNFFNMLWAMPGVALSGPDAAGAWMAEFGWAYDLARRWDGGFEHQGPPETRPDSYHGWDATGAMMLAFAQAGGRLQLTGATPSIVASATPQTAAALVADGRGWSQGRGPHGYRERSEDELLAGLGSWSPVVRERSAIELARREGDPTPRLIDMLDSSSLEARLGACQAIARLGGRAAAAVEPLRATLQAEDLWLRIKAADALAAIGDAAAAAIPDLLAKFAERDPEADPRGMQQRYLCFAVFDPREGLLGRSLGAVDREALREAIRIGLLNEDGRARGAVGSVYRHLSFRELQPLLPEILAAVAEPAPSGIMFADEVRVAGLRVLARHGIAEGLPLCLEVADPARWGFDGRIGGCLEALRGYGGAARPEIPRLRAIAEDLAGRGWTPDRIEALGIEPLIAEIEADDAPPTLRSIADLGA